MAKVEHLGIIPDGSRRWAHREKIDLTPSYRLAMKKLLEILSLSYDRGVNAVSVFLLSKANLKRSADDLDAVAIAEEELLAGMLPSLVQAFSLSVQFAGLLEIAPERIQAGARKLLSGLQASPLSRTRRLYLCIAYDPLDEMASAGPNFGSAGIRSLWVPEPINLVIRTGGAITLSNFLPIQCGYARIVFRDELFNDFSPETLLQLLQEHEELHLKFGE